MQNIYAVSGPRRLLRGGSRAAMVGLFAALAVVPEIGPAHAGNYTASNETELRNAINAANADGDPSATITLTANVTVSDPTAFPAFAKPTTLNTGSFTLSALDVASGPGRSLTFNGGSLLTGGTFRGGNETATNTNAPGGTGIALTNGSLDNSANVKGGGGSNNAGPGTAAGTGGAGIGLTNSTLVNRSTVTGGTGGTVDVLGSVNITNTFGGVGGSGLVMSGGSLNNLSTLNGGAGGNVINFGAGDNRFAGTGGTGASLTGGTHVNSGTINGGIGGLGANVGGSGHGAGGTGLSLAGSASFVNNSGGTIVGGVGRPGGGTSGSGGGAGATVTSSTFENAGTVRGGNAGGTVANSQGLGVTGSNGTVVNSGTISSGRLSLGAGALGNAITFTSGANRLELRTGYVIDGLVLANAANDTFALGGAANGSFDVSKIGATAQYRAFEAYQMTGAGTWTLTGTSTAVTPWQLLSGTLSVSSNANLGNALGAITFDGGILEVTGTSFTGTARTINWGAKGGGFEIADSTNVFTVSQNLTGGGPLAMIGPGTLVMTGSNTYIGGTTITGGTLQLGNGGASGNITGDVTNDGKLVFDRTGKQTFGGVISGSGSVEQKGFGTTVLTANNTYEGGTTIAGGELQLGNGGTSGSIKGDVLNNGELRFKRSDTVTFDGLISGSGDVWQDGGPTGVTILTGNNTYTGETRVGTGTLLVNGDQSGATGDTTIFSGTLGGKGIIGGNVSIAPNTTLAPGDLGQVPGTLTIAKNLFLDDGAILDYDFGQANVVGGSLNDHTKVGGNLTLDGIINVTLSPGGSFLPGVYRVISYDGALTNNGLDIGTMPPGPGPFFVQTAIANQVNLVNAAGLQLNYWDGDAGTKNSGVDGGDGTWNLVPGNINWTDNDGTANAPFKNGDFAIFAGAKGTVAVDNVSAGQVQISGMQFLTDGYVIEGGALEMVGAPTYIRVGDGSLGYTATIHSQLFGSSQLIVTDPGTLVLTAANTYIGGTKIAQGATVQVSQDASLGDISGGLTLDVGALRTTATFQTDRTVALDAQGQFLPDVGTTLTLGGPVSGPGSLVMGGAGELVLAAPATYAGDTTVAAGTLSGGAANVFSPASSHSVLSGATLNLNGYDQTVSALSNAGTVALNGLPGTTLTVTGNYTGAGGLIQFNTVLNDDASATDRLVVQGDTSGSTNVKVTNVGGTGAPTVEGIKIVDVGGASNGAFALQGDYVFHGEQAVIGGAYAYTLQKNGVSTPTDGDWYLRSALTNPPPGVPPAGPAGPLFQPGVPLYESYPQILLSLMSMPTLRERLGYDALGGRGPAPMPAAYIDEGGSYLGGPPVAGYERAPSYRDVGNAWWGRVDASRVSLEPSSTAAAAYDADQVRLQTGFDALIHADRAGKLLAGLTVQHGSSSARVDSVWGDGKINVEAYGIGGTLTWLGLNGFYVDTQAQVTWFDTDIRSSLAGTMAEGDDAVGYGISLETGKRFASVGPWALTPQAQLSYTSVDLDFTDVFGAEVSTRNGDSLLGRLGIALDYRNAWLGARSNMYGIANLYYEFLDGTSIDVSGTRFVSSKDELWGGLGVGGMYSWGADKYALFGEVSVNTSLDNFGDSYSVNGTAGFRTKW